MELWKSIAGMVEAELTSADLAGCFSAVNNAGITVFDLRQAGDLTARLRIRRSDYRLLLALTQKRGETLRLVSRRGVYWLGKEMLRRPVLLVGLLAFFVLAMYLPTRVFFVRVEGNKTVPTRLILAAAEECGIGFGASRREVRSEQVKNALLEAVPQLQWAGVNTAGCVATVSVRERAIEEDVKQEKMVSSIVAARDGVILSLTATSGNPVCQPGNAVKEGQVLISGYTDCGICIQATRAEGEVFAQTSRKIRAVSPMECCRIAESKVSGRKISLIIGKKRINLWKDSGISEGSCGRMYEEYYITLPGGFQLPAALCVETCYAYQIMVTELDQSEAEAALRDFSARYLTEQMVAGTIQNQVQTITAKEGVFLLEGNYICMEMIGRIQREQIGEANGKNS